MGKHIIATFYVGNENITVEVWLGDDNKHFIGIRNEVWLWNDNQQKIKRNVYRRFFTIGLWEYYTRYVEEMFGNDKEGSRLLGKKKKVTVTDVVKVTTIDNPLHDLILNKEQWMYIMKINKKMKKVINQEEEHFLIYCSTNVYVINKSTPFPFVVFDESDVRQGRHPNISQEAILQLQNHEEDIRKRMNAKNKEEQHLKLDVETFLHIVYNDSTKCWKFTLEKRQYALPPLFFELNEHDACRLIMDELHKILYAMKTLKTKQKMDILKTKTHIYVIKYCMHWCV